MGPLKHQLLCTHPPFPLTGGSPGSLAPASLPGAWRLRPWPGKGGGTWIRGRIPGQGQEIQAFMMGGGWRPREIRLWDVGRRRTRACPRPLVASFSQHHPHLHTHTKDCSICSLGIILGETFVVQPQDLESQPEEKSSSPFCDWGKGEEALQDLRRTCQLVA